jgi:MFS family permease
VSRAFNPSRGHAFFLLSAAAVLMSSIDNTIVAVAIPELERSFGAPLSWISWTLTVYQLVQVVMLPLAGKLSDSLGRTRLFVACVAIFTVSSLLCGMAPNIGLLIVFRALQAIGGGGLLPSAVGIIADQYRDRRAQAVGLISSVMPMGTILGPNLGGFLLQNWSWHALFWVNVPIGLVVVIGVLLLAEARPPAGQALCAALRPVVGQDRVWVYYQIAPLVPILRLPDLQRAGCELELPESRMRTPVPGQEIWVSLVRLLARARTLGGPPPGAAEIQAVLRQLAKDDFALVRTNPPLLFHNDLTATVSRYYWSEDAGYALWLRLHHEYAHLGYSHLSHLGG